MDDKAGKRSRVGDNVRGRITARTQGGLSVQIGEEIAFLPGSQVDVLPVKDLERLIGEEMEFRVIKHAETLILSRRVLLEEARQPLRKETLSRLEVGQIVTGIIVRVTDYGGWIDLGGIDGLLTLTDLSYGRVIHPGDILKLGEPITVMVLKIDFESQRIIVGTKQLHPDPWEQVPTRYPVGVVVQGPVVSMPDYGVFVQLEPAVEGLVHVSDMPSRRFKSLLKIGEGVTARVLGVDVERQRISLGMRGLAEE